jgi:hypothetical protein
MVDVTDRPHVDMGLCPLKYCFGHKPILLHWFVQRRFLDKTVARLFFGGA